MIIETLPVGLLQCNCTILGCEESKEAIVVDPGGDVDKILEIVKGNDLSVKKIIHTHAHIDHIWGTCELVQETGAEVLLHPEDKFLYDAIEMQGRFLGMPAPKTTAVDSDLEDNQYIAFGKGFVLCLHTPGHTPGSVCFCVRRKNQSGSAEEQWLLSGDTLFKRGVGRTDLWGGDQKTMFDSIKTKILSLDDDTHVIPGHGPQTLVGEERRANPFLNEL